MHKSIFRVDLSGFINKFPDLSIALPMHAHCTQSDVCVYHHGDGRRYSGGARLVGLHPSLHISAIGEKFSKRM